MAARNEAPPWWSLELRRALAEAGSRPTPAELRRLDGVLGALATEAGVAPRAVYLTPEQWRELAHLFSTEMEALNVPFTPLAPPGAERPFEPDLSRLPNPVLRRFARRLSKPGLAGRLSSEVLRSVQRVVDAAMAM